MTVNAIKQVWPAHCFDLAVELIGPLVLSHGAVADVFGCKRLRFGIERQHLDERLRIRSKCARTGTGAFSSSNSVTSEITITYSPVAMALTRLREWSRNSSSSQPPNTDVST